MTAWHKRPMKIVELWLGITCRDFTTLTSAELETPLSTAERLRRAMHRAMCSVCRLHEKRQHQLRALAHELSNHPPDDDAELPHDAKARLRSALEAAEPRPK
jgi:hypothetical protein